MYAEWPIGLELDGTYNNLGSFLERISKFPRIINVSAIHIKAKNDNSSQTIEASCTATTFVLVEAKPADAKASGKPGAKTAAKPAAPKA
jgi:Tfp pilus assembly protein PilO